MKKSILLVATFFISVAIFSQTLSNQLLGYQEPYAKMEGQAVDSAGNVYYAGTFKGPLVIEGQTMFNGNGGDDVFLAKTNSSGQLLWVKKYGEAGNENTKYLLLHEGALYLSITIAQSTTLQGNTITAYPAGTATNVIVKLDTSGSVQWVRKTSLLVEKILAGKNQIFLQGMLQPMTSSGLYMEENLLVEPTSSFRSLFVYLDIAGNYLGNKLVASNASFIDADILSSFVTTNGRIFYLLSISGQSMNLGNQTINFPRQAMYYVLVKTDTSFSDLNYKVLNPQGETYTWNLLNEYAGFSMAPTQDSLYMILGGSYGTEYYKLDGYNALVSDRNILLVMDTNFITKQAKPIGSNNIGGTPYKISISHIHSADGYYYFRGRLNGNNNAAIIDGITSQKQQIEILYGVKDSFDINGPNKSFLIKTSKDFSKSTFKWIGFHTAYQSQSVSPNFLKVQQNRIYFLHKIDNVWNPWIADTSLNIMKGQMVSNADRGDVVRYVKYFSDGSKGIIGIANRKTLLDTSNSPAFVNGLGKNDLFFVLLNKSEQVQWYKRLTHSFNYARVHKIVARNEKIYLTIVFDLPNNSVSSNYVRIDSTVYFISNLDISTKSVLLVFDKSGNFQLIQMNAPFNNSATFDVFKNGDIALVSTITSANLPLVGKQFSTLQGFYIAKFDEQGTLKDAIKFISTTNTRVSTPHTLIVDTLTGKFNFVSFATFLSGHSSNTITCHSGLTAPVNFSLTNPQPLLSADKSYFIGLNSSFNRVEKSATIGPLNTITSASATLKNKHYIIVGKTGMRDSIYYNANLLIPDTSRNLLFLLAMDTALNYSNHKIIRASNSQTYDYLLTHLTSHGDYLYASGSNSIPVQIDTVKIGHAGLNDAITVQFDTSLTAKKVFRLASIYSETMYGCDLFNDSLISFAYTAQGSPAFINGRFAARNTTIESSDLDENAYIQTVLLKTGVVTSVDEPLRVEGFKLFPNPVLSNMVVVDLGNTEAGRYQWVLYNTEGRLIESSMLMWSPRQTKQIQFSNRIQAGNYVLVIKTGQQKMLKAVKLTVL